MKKNLMLKLVYVFMFIGILSFGHDSIANKNKNYDGNDGSKAEPKSGKWIAVYNGGTTIQSCKCCSSLLASKCVVGDITTNTSLCGGEDPT